jgi:hypothetical protein
MKGSNKIIEKKASACAIVTNPVTKRLRENRVKGSRGFKGSQKKNHLESW